MDRKQTKRVVAILLAVAAAAALVVACFGKRWLAGPDYGDDFGVGLLAVEECVGQKCESLSTGEAIEKFEDEIERFKLMNQKLPANQQVAVPRAPWGGFATVGMITFIAALTAAGGLVIGALLALAGKRIDVAVMPTTIAVLALATSIINGCLFLATKPAFLPTMTIGWTFIAFGVGAIGGLAAVFPLNRQIRPIDPELGAASATISWGASRDDD